MNCLGHEEIRDLALFYALGSLSQSEAEAFDRHIAKGCETCRFELSEYEAVVAVIGYATPEKEPPSRTKERLSARLKQMGGEVTAESTATQFLSIRADEGRWKEVLDGVFVKFLALDEANASVTSLVRMMPGTRLPKHRHAGVEQFLVLEGDCHVHGDVLGPGDYHRAEAGSIHEITYTEGGTLFLLVAPADYEWLVAE